MRIRWRGFELPNRVVRDEDVSTDSYGRFVIEPFEQGFGTTIGNSLRRVLLSSLEGAAVTTVKIAGVSHEFASIDGVVEDVTDILLNIKGIVLRVDSDESKMVTVERSTAGAVLAGEIVSDADVTVANPDHVIATLTAEVGFRIEMKVSKGRGYATGSDNRMAEQESGVIPIDSVFSPVLRVRYRTEDMRVGQRTNYDRLIMEIWTNGTVLPEDALVEAGSILRKHLTPFVIYHDLGDQLATHEKHLVEMSRPEDTALAELLDKSVSVLSLSVRAGNCLDAAKIITIRQLVMQTESDLLRYRSFGKTSLHEVHRKLAEFGLTLGMRFDEAGLPIAPIPPQPLVEEELQEDEPAMGEGGSPVSGDEAPADGDVASEGDNEATAGDEAAPMDDNVASEGSDEATAGDEGASAEDSSISANSGSMEAYTMPDS